ncbi:MAG: hypothetical protein WBB07_07745 [Mycobacterium sp.]
MPANSDVMSDPGKGAGERSDWADEGGATAQDADTAEEHNS